MWYLGSKNRIAKEIVPIIQSFITDNTTAYVEPFAGGGNIIDKISCKRKIGCDIHKQLIELFKFGQNHMELIPDVILKEEYDSVRSHKERYRDWYVGLVGFCASFGAKYFGGYARHSADDIHGDWSRGAIKNLKEQLSNLSDVEFYNISFQDLPVDNIENCVVYCDPPYRNTTKYKIDAFPYDEYYDFVRRLSKKNIVLCSEYEMPNDFQCIWQKEIKVMLDSNREKSDDRNKRIEKLFIYK